MRNIIMEKEIMSSSKTSKKEIMSSSKTAKKTPFMVWLVLFLFLVAISVYIVCFMHITMPIKEKEMFIKGKVDATCDISDIPPEENLNVHFPRPKTYSRDECACTPVRFFVIMSMQRSGSGWFETLLNSHLNISSNGEVFSVKQRRSNMSNIQTTLDTVYSLDWISSAAKNECVAAVGFKWMLNQAVMVYHKQIANYFNWKGVSVIFLFRKNLLRRLISVLANAYDRDAKLINGTHKSHVHTRKEADLLARFKPTLNISALIPALTSAEHIMAASLEYFKSSRHMILYYEDLIKNPMALLDAQEFLRVPVRKLESHHVKIHTKPLSEQINNWDDVYRTLEGSQYEHFLHTTDYIS